MPQDPREDPGTPEVDPLELADGLIPIAKLIARNETAFSFVLSVPGLIARLICVSAAALLVWALAFNWLQVASPVAVSLVCTLGGCLLIVFGVPLLTDRKSPKALFLLGLIMILGGMTVFCAGIVLSGRLLLTPN